jgi:NADPH-dependent F420 reductase
MAAEAPMQIAILGTGRMARGIGYALRESAHDLTFGSREAQRAESLAKQMSEEHARRYRGATLEAAAARADLAFLAVPFGAAPDTARAVAASLADKVLVDLTNPLNDDFDGVTTLDGTSAAEEIARAAGPQVKLVAALKHTFAATFAEPRIGGGPAPDVLVCGDDVEAKKVVMALVEAMGFGALDAGRLKVARTLERMTVLLLDLTQRNHWNGQAGFKLVH